MISLSFLPSIAFSSSSSLFRNPKFVRFLAMADQIHPDLDGNQMSNTPNTPVNYPIPLSPPLPSISKEIELSRAMSASSRSALFSLSGDDVLYEDQWLMAVNKPPGVYCESVLSAVPCLLNDSTDSAKLELHLANRLDRDTSGVMLITKSHKIAAALVKAFTHHKVKKTYIALCVGPAPTWDKITVKSGHGRSKFGVWRVYATSNVGRSLPGGSVVKDMETRFEILSINGRKKEDVSKSEERVLVVEEKGGGGSGGEVVEVVVRASPRSGRTHQIRLHCQYLGISIRGDVKYEGVCEWGGRRCDGHELHAHTLWFEHPVTAQAVLVQAPLPLWATLSRG